MLTAGDIVRRKNATVATTEPPASVRQAAQAMNERRIGSLVVLEGGRIVGIITERDILTRVVAAALDPVATHVRDVMTREVICCEPRTTLGSLRALMQERRIRHVPVLDDSRLVGLVSIGDINAEETEVLVQTVHSLEGYITQG